MPSKSKPLGPKELAAYEAKRDLAADWFDWGALLSQLDDAVRGWLGVTHENTPQVPEKAGCQMDPDGKPIDPTCVPR
ncbi:MAG TPA: hypothetical protein PK413_08045 [Thermoanaerobaculia bacterium]|nr:hypothetical protein [Thermoanaerobaculia bacterium]